MKNGKIVEASIVEVAVGWSFPLSRPRRCFFSPFAMPTALADAPGPAAALAAIAAVPPPAPGPSLRDDDCLLRTTREF